MQKRSKNGYAEMVSKSRKCGFIVVPSVSDGVLNLPSQREGATPERVSKMWVRRVQNVFCCSTVRIGRGFKSSLSERGSYTGTGVQNVTGEWREQMENSYAQRHSNVSESWEKNEKHYVQRHSKSSECEGSEKSEKQQPQSGL